MEIIKRSLHFLIYFPDIKICLLLYKYYIYYIHSLNGTRLADIRGEILTLIFSLKFESIEIQTKYTVVKIRSGDCLVSLSKLSRVVAKMFITNKFQT